MVRSSILTCFNSCHTKHPPVKLYLLDWPMRKVFEINSINIRHSIYCKFTHLIAQLMRAMHRKADTSTPPKNTKTKKQKHHHTRKLKTDKFTGFTTCAMEKHRTPREKLKGKLTITCWSEGINSRAFWITRQPYICSASDRTWPRMRSAKASFCSRLPN